MANTYQSRTSNYRSNAGNGNANNGGNNYARRAAYLGTPAIMAPDENTGTDVLVTLAIHQLNDGTFAVVNGNAITTDDQGEPIAINATYGYQSLDAAKLSTAIANAKAIYTVDLNCGPLFGVQEGRLVHLQPEDAKAYGVDLTRCETVDSDGVKDDIAGIIGISASAYLGLMEAANGILPQPVVYKQPRVLDTFPFEQGLALAKSRNPMTDVKITNAQNVEVFITAFPRGNQRTTISSARQQDRIAKSPLAGLNTGRKAS